MRLAPLYIIGSLVLFSCTHEQRNDKPLASPFDSLPKHRVVTAFSGVDQNGSEFSASAMKGKYWLASFFFTRCSSVCPALNTVLAGLQKDFGANVSFVSLSSDPTYDTPSVMKAYGAQYGAKEGVWWFVNMPLDSMMRVASRDLGLVEPTSPDIHSTRFVLIDKAMTVRGFYDSADTADVSKLRSILKALP